jgi:hypothetical protein
LSKYFIPIYEKKSLKCMLWWFFFFKNVGFEINAKYILAIFFDVNNTERVNSLCVSEKVKLMKLVQ